MDNINNTQQSPFIDNQQITPPTGVHQMDNGTGVFPKPSSNQAEQDNVMTQSHDYKDGTGPSTQEQNDSKSSPKFSKTKIMIMTVCGLLVFVLIVGVALTVAPKGEKKEPINAGDLEFETDPFKYTHDEIVELRKAGYTGDEIEDYEAQMFDSADLIKQAEDERYAIYESEIAPYYDEASDEVKALYENSWCGQPDLEITDNTDEYKYMTSTINVDYEKLPPTGYQCFIKVYIHDDKPAFMTITPDRYVALNESGNIVLQVDYIIMSNGARCITQMKEIIP